MNDEAPALTFSIVTSCLLKCEPDTGGRVRFWRDDIIIEYRNHVRVVDDLVYGRTEYVSLIALVKNEYFRWEE